MKFSSQEEYGLRCMVSLARNQGGRALTIGDVARAEKLTSAYVGKLMRILRKGGLVGSLHGPTGGYVLVRDASLVSIADILAVLGGRLYDPEYCRRHPGEVLSCVHTSECAIRSILYCLDLVIGQILRNISLADLAKSEKPLARRIREQIPAFIEAATRAAGAVRPKGTARS